MRGSKMAKRTQTQTQTVWAPEIRDLADILETHLAKVKHKVELKLWHPDALDHGRLLHVTIYWKNGQAATHPLVRQTSILLVRWAAAHQATAHLPVHRPAGPPHSRPTRMPSAICQRRVPAPPDTGCKPA
jgi:hypothetical protein